MKHLLIIPSWYPSRHIPISGIFFKEQAEILSKKIDKVGVVSPLFRTARHIDATKNRSFYGVENEVITYTKEIWHYPFLKKINLNNWFNTCKFLFEKYISENGMPDIIHVHSITIAGCFAKYTKEKYNIPFVITEHSTGFALNVYDKKSLKRFGNEMKSSSYNIAVSEGLANILMEKMGGVWKVIPNTIQDVFFQEGIANVDMPKAKDKKIFFSLSNLIPTKGVDVLVTAFSKLIKENPHVELWIGGDGSERERLKKQIKELKIEDKVFLLGKLDRNVVMEKLKKVHYYISPSLQETFGIVIIEALAMGLPTIATKCGGPEYIINEGVGILVDKGSAEKLYSAMKAIIENEEKYNSNGIIDYCKENYSEDVVGNRIINVYREVLNG